MAPLLEAHRVTGPRGAARVHEASLSVERSEVVHVRGESGSGKTSLLRLLAQIDPLEAGAMRLAGTDADSIAVDTWRRRVGLLFQEPRLFPGTIRHNIEWAATQHRLDVDAAALLDAVGLPLDLDRDIARLSGGEAKRVQLARALAVRPDVLLLDEPTASLDRAHRDVVRDLVRRLADDGYGIIVVSHLDEDHAGLSGRVLTMDGGRIVEEASV